MKILLGILFILFYISTSSGFEPNMWLFVRLLLLGIGFSYLVSSILGVSLAFRIFLLVVLSYGYWYFLMFNRSESFDDPEILTFTKYLEINTHIAEYFSEKNQRNFYNDYVKRLKNKQANEIMRVTKGIVPFWRLCAQVNRYTYQFYTLTGRYMAQKMHLEPWINRPKTRWQQYTLSWRSISVLRERILGISSILVFLGFALIIQGALRKPNSAYTYNIEEGEVMNREGIFRLTGITFVFVMGSLGFCLIEITTVGLPYVYAAIFTPAVFAPAVWFMLLRNTR
ncbi:MAG: hypothetical protein GVY36_17115 [Verrucomicrobia bacterium]|jgi:hypothetical protein|nr:hypothetical protein [Verrucomicrobiota bacterium]